MFQVHSVDEIKGLIQAHEQFKATLNEAQKEKENICGLMREAAKIARQVRYFQKFEIFEKLKKKTKKKFSVRFSTGTVTLSRLVVPGDFF